MTPLQEATEEFRSVLEYVRDKSFQFSRHVNNCKAYYKGKERERPVLHAVASLDMLLETAERVLSVKVIDDTFNED